MDAEFRQRDQKLKEADQQMRSADQQLKQAKMKMEGLKQQFDAMKDMREMGIETDIKEADIMLKYSQAFKNLAEIDASEIAAEAQAIENQFINHAEGGDTNGSREAATPASNTRTSPAMGS
jgi:predicted RNase H-like nuclease (RuvC/YqgF family)